MSNAIVCTYEFMFPILCLTLGVSFPFSTLSGLGRARQRSTPAIAEKSPRSID